MRIKYVGSGESWYFSDLARAAAGRHEIAAVEYGALQASIDGEPSSRQGAVAVFGACEAAIIRSMPLGSLEQVIFRMDVLAQLQDAGVYLLNSPRAMEVAIDKLLATARLAAAGLPTPSTHASQQWKSAMQAFVELGGDVVVKPLFGGEGRGITRICDEDLAQRAFKMLAQMGAVIYQQRYIEHGGSDIRVLLLGEQTWAVRRRNAGDWRTNVSRGATAEPMQLDAGLMGLARRAADAVGAVFAGVDILEGRDGKRYVLEVNAVPGWKALSQTLNVDVAAAVLDHIDAAVRARDSI